MLESQVRALFEEIAAGEPAPSLADTQLALRRGRTRLRWRRAGLAGTPVLAAVAAVVVALAAGLTPARLGIGPVAAGPAAPRQFSPLVPYVSFGWLPPGDSLVSGGTSQAAVYLNAGPKPNLLSVWGLTVYAGGQCHLTAPARSMKCSTLALNGLTARITARAPAVRGHRAFWAGPYLVWQYARGGWALLVPPMIYSPQKDAAKLEAAKREAVKIADHVRYGAPTPPLVFPAQVTHLPDPWRVSSVYYQPDAGVLRASRYALGTGTPDLGADGGLVYQSNLPSLVIDPATSRNSCGKSHPEIISGYRVIVTHRDSGTFHSQGLCAANADGWALFIGVNGPHPVIDVASLFRHHLRLLGTNPANWSSKPIG